LATERDVIRLLSSNPDIFSFKTTGTAQAIAAFMGRSPQAVRPRALQETGLSSHERIAAAQGGPETDNRSAAGSTVSSRHEARPG
jgi:hypothetical protein